MSAHIYRKRQKALCKKIPEGVALIFSAKEIIRNRDVCFPFRQESNFKYLTGLDEPEAILVLSALKNNFSSTIFVRPKNRKIEQWEGIRPGPKRAEKLAGADASHSLEEFNKLWPSLMVNHQRIYTDLGHKGSWEMILSSMTRPLGERYKKTIRPTGVEELASIMGQLRLVKGAEEIKEMRKMAQISCYAHRGAMAMAQGGISEGQVGAFFQYLLAKEGGGHHLAYPSIVASGKNALILHYRQNSATLKKGELLLLDAGGELNGYASDITRTFPISGTYTEAQKEVYRAVLNAQKKALSSSGPGKTLASIHNVAVKSLVSWLKEQKIIKKEDDYKKYYPHSTGHWLGLDVHDAVPYRDEKNHAIKLAPGMVFTVEPGLYFPSQDKAVPSHFRGIGIRIEDDILVTKNGVENLSAKAPKEIKEVEDACKRDYREFF